MSSVMMVDLHGEASTISRALSAGGGLRRRRALAGSVARQLGRTVVKARHLKRSSVAAFHQHRRRMRQELQELSEEAKAEATEFITAPHLLFRPVTLTITLVVPLLVPLVFMPYSVLAAYFVAVLWWYTTFVAVFAAEVAMRPPWYKTGLALTGQPPYWRGKIHDPRTDLGLDYEDIEFPTTDGATLRGWFVPGFADGVESRNVVVCVHGAGRDRRAFLRHAEVLVRNGYSALLFDFLEHGTSDGTNRGVAFGVREQFDVLAAVSFVHGRVAGANVFVLGTSAGGSSAILAAARAREAGSSICGVVAENPLARPGALYAHHLRGLLENYLSQNKHHLGRRLLFWYFSRVLLLRIGLGLSDRGGVDVVKRIDCPLLVMHSTTDEIVPFEHGEAIFEQAAEPKEFWRVEDADHCALFDKYPNAWESRVLGFLKRHSPQTTS